MPTKRVLLDCDGVLSDFLTRALEVINTAGPHDFKHEHVTHFDICEGLGVPHLWENLREACGTPGFVMGLNVMPGAKEGVEKLQQHAEVFCVTSPMSVPNWALEREKWLEHHFDIKKSHVAQLESKHIIPGDYFVDDKIENIEIWAEHHPNSTAIIFDAPYNRNHRSKKLNVIRARDWVEVVGFIAPQEIKLELTLDCPYNNRTPWK